MDEALCPLAIYRRQPRGLKPAVLVEGGSAS